MHDYCCRRVVLTIVESMPIRHNLASRTPPMLYCSCTQSSRFHFLECRGKWPPIINSQWYQMDLCVVSDFWNSMNACMTIYNCKNVRDDLFSNRPLWWHLKPCVDSTDRVETNKIALAFHTYPWGFQRLLSFETHHHTICTVHTPLYSAWLWSEHYFIIRASLVACIKSGQMMSAGVIFG